MVRNYTLTLTPQQYTLNLGYSENPFELFRPTSELSLKLAPTNIDLLLGVTSLVLK